MLLNKANLAVVNLASKDETRFALNGVYVSPAGTVATDGHVLGIVTLPTNVDVKDFPACGDVEETAAPLVPCIIGPDAVKAIARAIPKSKNLPILNHARIDVATSNANGSLRVITTDLDVTLPCDARKIQAEFPAYEQVIPGESDPALRVSFNAELLRRVLDTAIAAGMGGTSHAVTLHFYPSTGESYLGERKVGALDGQPMKITTANVETGQTATFVVMPMRI